MLPIPPTRIGGVFAALAVAGVMAAWTVAPERYFAPGTLHAGDSTPRRLGGVESHAALANRCGECHAPLFGGAPRSARCLRCHDDVQREITARDTASVHGALAAGDRCTSCHTEHLGPTGEITSMAGSRESHARFGFPLDGAHASASCAACHQSAKTLADYRRAPRTCIGCHEKDDTHRGEMGTDCAECHGTRTWEGARFEHDAFPVDHGSNRPSSCSTCHEDRTNYKSYTCYNCHEHSPARVQAEHRGEVRAQNLDNCLECHRGGRKHGEREGRREREHDED